MDPGFAPELTGETIVMEPVGPYSFDKPVPAKDVNKADEPENLINLLSKANFDSAIQGQQQQQGRHGKKK
jgi:hypothetical protein